MCRRAGVVPKSPAFNILVQKILGSKYVSLYGFYCHAGDAYGSTSLKEAASFLSSEVQLVNDAARITLDTFNGGSPYDSSLVLSVGSTPSAHAASEETRAQLRDTLNGILELHAGKVGTYSTGRS